MDNTSAEFLTGKTTPGMPGYQPPVKPGSGSDPIKGSMTKPPVPQQPKTPSPTGGNQPPVPTSTTPFALSQVMSALESKVQSNNALMTQRQLLLKHLYDQPLTDAEKQQLDPTLLPAVNSGDKNQIDMRLRLISDQIAGRNNTLDQSIQYLTTAYKDTITQADNQKKDAITALKDYMTASGDTDSMKKALTSVYGPVLKGMGIDASSFFDSVHPTDPVPTTTPTGKSGYGAEILQGTGLDPAATVKDLTDAQMNTLLGSMFPHEQGAGVPFNNPANLKFSAASASFGAYDSGHKALDGGTFAGFKSQDDAMKAYKGILKGPGYANLSLDAALKRWSNYKPGSDSSSSVPKGYEQYGLLSKTNFNPTLPVDKNASDFLDLYLKSSSGTMPTASTMFGRSNAGTASKFVAAKDRAEELYFQATGSSLPDLANIKTTKALIAANNKVLNSNAIASDVVGRNFDLAIKGEITNNVNTNATAINKILDPIYLALGDPAVNQAMVSNGTISQEFANLIAIRNQGGTLAADKEMGSELIKFGTSVEAQKAVVERLKAEALNIHGALKDQNSELWKQVDPLEQNPQNPNRQAKANKSDSSAPDFGSMSDDELTKYIKAHGG